MSAEIRRLQDRITDYLLAGGLWNPELMEHDKVRLLLFDIRDELGKLTSPVGQEEPRVAVAGRLDRTIADFERSCLVLLEEEQGKPLPDNALIATLCDAVRLARETGPRPVGQEEPHPAIVFNRWFETAAAGEPFFPGLYSSDQLRTVAWLAFQAGRSVTPSWHPPVEEQGGRQKDEKSFTRNGKTESQPADPSTAAADRGNA